MKLFNRDLFRFFVASVCCLNFGAASLAQEAASTETYDPNIQYLMQGKSTAPWELSLNFGKTPIDTLPTETAKSSLTASSATKIQEGDAIHLKWTPKGIEDEWGGTHRVS